MIDAVSTEIRALRRARKITQKGLALLSGLSQQHLSYLEQGRGGIELATLRKVLGALGHELAIVPCPPLPAAALAQRARQWDQVAAWEMAQRPTAGSLSRAGALADFFLSRHQTPATQPALRSGAERVRAARELLARIKVS
jgi:transcriptional regulator with XRE-family HTH domain